MRRSPPACSRTCARSPTDETPQLCCRLTPRGRAIPSERQGADHHAAGVRRGRDVEDTPETRLGRILQVTLTVQPQAPPAPRKARLGIPLPALSRLACTHLKAVEASRWPSQGHPARYAGTRARVEARATPEQAEELRRAAEGTGRGAGVNSVARGRAAEATLPGPGLRGDGRGAGTP
jgi:hypothetical protein